MKNPQPISYGRWTATQLVGKPEGQGYVLLRPDCSKGGIHQKRVDLNGQFSEVIAERIVDCVNACDGMSDPGREIEILRSHSCLRTICEALGWQGGTIHQAAEAIEALRAQVALAKGKS